MKRILFLLTLFVGLVFAGHAQISTSWTALNTSSYAPTGATIPTVTALDSPTPARLFFEVELDKTTYDNATQTTAWTAIGAGTKTAVDSNYVQDIWGLNPASDIDGIVYITGIRVGEADFELADLKNQYKACEDVYIVTGYFEWAFQSP